VVVRTAGDPMAAATTVEREVRRIDPDVAASQIRPMGRYASDAIAPRRFSLSMMTAFGAAALALAAIGIYAVVSYAAGQRTREIAIRMALGARRSAVVMLVMRDGMLAAAIGLITGLAMTAAATPLLSSLLFGVAPGDPVTLAQVALGVMLLAAAACAWPAARACRRPANLIDME